MTGDPTPLTTVRKTPLVDQYSIVVVRTVRVIVGTDNLDGVLDHKWGLDLLATDH